MQAVRILLESSIDYAGLFPPAALDMTTAAANYARYRSDEIAWALGRFILPAFRLGELAEAAHNHLPRKPAPPWRLGALIGPDVAADLEQVTQFQRHASSKSVAVTVDSLEVKASSVGAIEGIMRPNRGGLEVYVEIPIERDPGELIAAIAARGGRAKVRTGGVTRDAFPTAGDLLRFIKACVRARVPFKATAGLHHAFRAEYPLTYAPDSVTGPMFGFLNLLLAASFLYAGMGEKEAERMLLETSPRSLHLDESGIHWHQHRLDLDALRRARRHAIISFGSCSFTEPIGELQALHLLETRVLPA